MVKKEKASFTQKSIKKREGMNLTKFFTKVRKLCFERDSSQNPFLKNVLFEDVYFEQWFLFYPRYFPTKNRMNVIFLAV